MANDLFVLTRTYLVLWVFQILAWPWLFHFNKKLVDYGWAAGRILSSLVLATLTWLLAHLKLPVNNQVGLGLIMILFFYISSRKLERGIQVKKVIVVEELLFLIGFIIYGLIRGFQPDILGLEKFMDFGFIKSYLSSLTLPAPDMWWAGSPINYYSFGHFWSSIFIRSWGVNTDVGYNLMLALILASTLSLSYSLIINLFGVEEIKKRHSMGAFIGALIVALGGNGHTIWSILTKRTFEGYWYADATRFIQNTIHEFPSYSFVVSDLHGHLLDLPVVLVFLLFFVSWTKGTRTLSTEITMGWLLGVMAMTNTWDVLTCGLLVTIAGGLVLLSKESSWQKLTGSALRIGIAVGVTAFFWLVNFDSISDGVAIVSSRSPLNQLVILWGIHVAVTITALKFALAKKVNLSVVAFGLTALVLILIPEIIYIRDIYSGYPRANTMFKLTYQAFIMMGLVFGFVFTKTIEIKNTWLRTGAGMMITATTASLLIFPVNAFATYYSKFSDYRGLSGFGFLAERYSEDLAMIEYLDKNKDGRNMVEAVGDSYTETDFVSAFSGVPTVLGWRVHEWLWRGGYETVGKRDEEVRNFYEGSSTDETKTFLEKYKIGWVVVSKREREKYKSLNLRKIIGLGELTTFGDAYLIKVN